MYVFSLLNIEFMSLWGLNFYDQHGGDFIAALDQRCTSILV